MTKQITTLNLCNNLKVNLVLENNKIKVQPTLTLFTLGDQKPFTYSLCLTTNNNISNQSFGLFASNSFDCRFYIEEPTANVPNGCLKYEDVFGNVSLFYKKTLNSNIYYSLDGKLKIEVIAENNFNIFKILDTEDNIITYKNDSSNVLQDCIDMYDSYQRGVSTEGILLGAALTAISSAGMLYLNKGIMWASTTIGTAICPGIGTAIGFAIGLVGSILVDIFLGGWIADLIDDNIK